MVQPVKDRITIKELKEKFSDRWWRLNNLYYIKNEEGQKVLFKPKNREIQKELHDNLWFRNIVPKARQLGVTTFFTILYFDQILFSENKTACIIAHTQDDMKKIFSNKIEFAWDNLHPWLKKTIGKPKTNTTTELEFPNGSKIFVSLSTRSDTIQFLHISEFGYICQKFPEKAEEIVTGAFNSVHTGQMISVESTAKGSSGYFHDFCMEAHRLEQQGKELTPLDWNLFFFPWFVDDKYRLDGDVTIAKEEKEYFKKLEEKEGIILDGDQKRWYVKKKRNNQENMFQEFPSTLAEAFRQNVEGAYYKNQMAKVYNENRIQPIPHDPELRVDTWWDLGMNDFNVILLTQTKGPQIRFIDMYWNQGEGLEHYVKWLEERGDEKGYRYGRHYLPHDVEVREMGTGISRKESLLKLGLRPMKVGKKLDVIDGINAVRKLFSKFYFDESNCERLVKALGNYRKEYDKRREVFKDRPRHDEHSHFADPVRLLAQEWREGIKEYESSDGGVVSTPYGWNS